MKKINKRKNKIVFIIVLTILMQIVGPVSGKFSYAEKAEVPEVNSEYEEDLKDTEDLVNLDVTGNEFEDNITNVHDEKEGEIEEVQNEIQDVDSDISLTDNHPNVDDFKKNLTWINVDDHYYNLDETIDSLGDDGLTDVIHSIRDRYPPTGQPTPEEGGFGENYLVEGTMYDVGDGDYLIINVLSTIKFYEFGRWGMTMSLTNKDGNVFDYKFGTLHVYNSEYKNPFDFFNYWTYTTFKSDNHNQVGIYLKPASLLPDETIVKVEYKLDISNYIEWGDPGAFELTAQQVHTQNNQDGPTHLSEMKLEVSELQRILPEGWDEIFPNFQVLGCYYGTISNYDWYSHEEGSVHMNKGWRGVNKIEMTDFKKNDSGDKVISWSLSGRMEGVYSSNDDTPEHNMQFLAIAVKTGNHKVDFDSIDGLLINDGKWNDKGEKWRLTLEELRKEGMLYSLVETDFGFSLDVKSFIGNDGYDDFNFELEFETIVTDNTPGKYDITIDAYSLHYEDEPIKSKIHKQYDWFNQTPMEPGKTSIDVEKKWVGEEQESVTINLLADGEEVKSVELNADNNWKHTFEDLPIVNDIKDEKAIEYTIEEVEIDGYTVSITGNTSDGFIITNTEKKVEPEPKLEPEETTTPEEPVVVITVVTEEDATQDVDAVDVLATFADAKTGLAAHKNVASLPATGSASNFALILSSALLVLLGLFLKE